MRKKKEFFENTIVSQFNWEAQRTNNYHGSFLLHLADTTNDAAEKCRGEGTITYVQW